MMWVALRSEHRKSLCLSMMANAIDLCVPVMHDLGLAIVRALVVILISFIPVGKRWDFVVVFIVGHQLSCTLKPSRYSHNQDIIDGI